MCIFTSDVDSVSNTKILVAPLPGGRQITVYENQAQTSVPNTMILPVPSGQDIELLDLSKKFPGQTLWKQVDKLFPQEQVAGGFAFGGGFGSTTKDQPLEVRTVGSYQCSVARNIGDLERADKNVFTMPPNIAKVLRTHYEKDFAFVICKFGGPKISGHPIAYTSARMRDTGALFIPTRHEHGNGGEGVPNYTLEVMSNQNMSHMGVTCDVCNQSPIVGTRWQAAPHIMASIGQMMNYSNFDMCDACYRNPDNNLEQRKRPFVEWRMPVQWYAGHFKMDATKQKEDLFDHTIYILNAVIATDPRRYNSLTHGFVSRMRETVHLGRDLLEGQDIRQCQKVRVVGDFANMDYVAYPIQ